MAETGTSGRRGAGAGAGANRDARPQAGSRSRTRTRAGAAGAAEAPPAAEPSEDPVCTVAFCPICMAVTTARDAAPEAVEHLLVAAREFFLAARSLIDVRADDLGDGDRDRSHLERIDIA